MGKSKAEGTYTNLCYANRMLCEFIKDLGSTDIEIRSITEELFEEYRFFLKKKGLKGSSIKQLSLLAEPFDVPCGKPAHHSL